MRSVARLARVQTPTPRVLALTSCGDGSEKEVRALAVRVVVQIRPQLLHYVHNGQLMCVVQSGKEICAMAECRSEAAGNAPQLLVSTTDGSVHLVRLPSTRQSPTKPILLQETPMSDDGFMVSSRPFVRRVADVPGVQQLKYIASLDAVVCTSLLVPTTVVRGVCSPKGASQVQEIEELEGEQSTCVTVVDRGGRVTVLQGDTDGIVRAARLKDDKSVSGSEVVRLQEPVKAIFPLCTVGGLDDDTLVIGACGSVARVLSSRTTTQVLRGRFSAAVQSAVLVLDDAEPSVLLVTTAKTILCVPLAGLLTQLQQSTATLATNTTIVELTATTLAHASLQDIVSIGSHGSPPGVVSCLNRSGLLFSLPRDELVVADHAANPATPPASSEHRVKNLLQEISNVSQQSAQLQIASRRADDVLNALNSALLVRQLVASRGVKALASCRLRMKLVASGWALHTKRVHLRFVFQTMSAYAESLLAGSTWRISITVHAGGARVFSYSFALSTCVGVERTIELADSVLHHLDGVVHVSTELVFVSGSTDAGSGDNNQHLASFSIPITVSQAFYLVQLVEPVVEFPLNPSALRDLFRQDHERFLSDSSHELLQGHQWWPVILQFATDAGVSLRLPDGLGNSSLPLRFVLHVPRELIERSSRSSTVTDPKVIQEDEVVGFLAQVFGFEGDEENAAWRAACRVVSGKWWVGLRTHAGNLIVLRLATAPSSHDSVQGEAAADRVEITIQSASVSDLAAMRALLAHVRTECSASFPDKTWSVHEIASASLALSATREELSSLAATMEDTHRKLVASAREEVQLIDRCQNEWLQLLQRTAHVETRSIDLYWKSREVVNQRLPLL